MKNKVKTICDMILSNWPQIKAALSQMNELKLSNYPRRHVLQNLKFINPASSLNYQRYLGTSPPSFSGDNNNQPGSDYKQAGIWVTGGCSAAPTWPWLAGSGDSRPAATQAAPAGGATGESRLVTLPCALHHPSSHSSFFFFHLSFWPWLSDFIFPFHMLSTSSLARKVSLHLQFFPNSLLPFICTTFSFIKRLSKYRKI